MTHDHERLHQIQYRWQREQQLIRRKYQIQYNMTYTFPQCHRKLISNSSQIEYLVKINQEPVIPTKQVNKYYFKPKANESNIPPMYCSNCRLNLLECLCQNGLGQWWIHFQKKLHPTSIIEFFEIKFENILFQGKSLLNSIHDRHVSFDTSLIDLSSTEKTNSQSHQTQYVLLDLNNRQSLLNFIRITQLTKNFSNLTIEQLQDLITNNKHIHIFNSIIDLTQTITKEQNHLSLCQIYIDPSYYSTISDSIPFSQSHLLAANTNR